MGQPVDNQVVLTRLLQIEWFNMYTFNIKGDSVFAVRYLQIEFPEEGLVTYWPANIGAKRQAYSTGLCSHSIILLFVFGLREP